MNAIAWAMWLYGWKLLGVVYQKPCITRSNQADHCTACGRTGHVAEDCPREYWRAP